MSVNVCWGGGEGACGVLFIVLVVLVPPMVGGFVWLAWALSSFAQEEGKYDRPPSRWRAVHFVASAYRGFGGLDRDESSCARGKVRLALELIGWGVLTAVFFLVYNNLGLYGMIADVLGIFMGLVAIGAVLRMAYAGGRAIRRHCNRPTGDRG